MTESTQKIKQILVEIYGLDPLLRESEEELLEIISSIMGKKPDIAPDAQFVALLRERLSKRADSREKNKMNCETFYFKLKHMKNLINALYGATAALLVLVVSIVVFFPRMVQDGGGAAKKNVQYGLSGVFDFKLQKAESNKFGKLSSQQGSSAAESRSVATGIGGGGAVSSNQPALSKADAASIMPPYELKNYKFVYKGVGFKVEQSEAEVLKRIKGIETGLDANQIAKNFAFGGIDIASFSGLDVQNINFVQNGDFGYSVFISLDEGTVSVWQNWASWPRGKCGSDSGCYEALRVKEGDIPADEELISIADAFLKDHKVSRDGLGDPQVLDAWRPLFAAAENKEDYYIPDSIDVVYPLKIQDRFIFDEYNGSKQGISISIDIKSRRASALYGLTTQSYESSKYAVITDPQKILAYAEKGGTSYLMNAPSDKFEEVEIGEPENAYIRYWNYKDGSNEELLVPAFVFPVISPPKDPNFNRKAVVVPIEKGIFEERILQGIEPSPTPLIESGVKSIR